VLAAGSSEISIIYRNKTNPGKELMGYGPVKGLFGLYLRGDLNDHNWFNPSNNQMNSS
jgi:hypothetical protein